MKKPLPTQFVCKERSKRWKAILLSAVAFVFLSVNPTMAQTFGTVECQCLENGTTSDNGQFRDIVSINGMAGDTWSVVSSTGAFDINSAVPPAAPTPLAPGTMFQSFSTGNFVLSFIRENDSDFEIIVTDGTSNYVVNSIHTCRYQSQAILGDFGVCVGGIEDYSLDATGAQNIEWTVEGGTILAGQGSSLLRVSWDNVPVGSYMLSYTATAPSYPGQLGGCGI